VLEFNVRFGDPETQVILPLLESDLCTALWAATETALDTVSLAWRPEACVCVVCAAPGYPGTYPKGLAISGLEQVAQDAPAGVMVFHAGTRRADGAVVTAGGRVLGVTARAPDLRAAIARAYHAVGALHFEGMHYRKDIGSKALGRSR
jgi:phosphoribosylamine--glycine ligase